MTTLPRRPLPLGSRTLFLVVTAVASVWSIAVLDLRWDQVLLGREDLRQLGRFLLAALRPALSHSGDAPPGSEPLLEIVLDSVVLTVSFAVSAMSLAVVAGTALGFLGSTVWWEDDPVGARTPWVRWLRRTVAPAIYGTTRIFIGFLRSIHELIWALLFLAAFGLGNLGAILAIALPYTGTLAKVFSESLDEAPRAAGDALRAAGAGAVQVVLFGIFPRAVPDIFAYALYRFECALRSSAILGFFGWQTLGYHVRLEWGMADYREVWTYLYALLLLVVLLDFWSASLRRRFVA